MLDYSILADLKWFRGDEELTDSVTIKGEDDQYSKSELTITVNRLVDIQFLFSYISQIDRLKVFPVGVHALFKFSLILFGHFFTI